MTTSSYRFTRALRVEDVLMVFGILMIASLGGITGAIGHFHVSEDQYWLLSFILFPLALITFIGSLRYALGPADASASRRLSAIMAGLRDWSPFFVLLLFYSAFQLNVWLQLRPQTLDAPLLAIDRRLLGETPAVTMQRWISRPATNLLTLAYFLHLVLPPAMAVAWYWRDLRRFRQLLLAVLAAGVIGSIGYALVPAVGPGFYFPHLFNRSLTGDVYQPITKWLDVARMPRDAFPSLHVAISAIVLYSGWRRGRTAFLILLPLVLANWISTMYLRYHYFIDVIAGWITAAAAIGVANLLLWIEGKVKRQSPELEPQTAAHDASE